MIEIDRMATTTMSSDRNHGEPVLPDDALVEILSRVPHRSVCRFKCVSRSWLALCSCPQVRKRSPLIIAGFFCHARGDKERRLLSTASGKIRRPLVDPSFLFLRRDRYDGLQLLDSCNGLLLFRCWSRSRLTKIDQHFVVCNPVNEKWLVLPRRLSKKNVDRIFLGFEPAISSHFTVFAFSTLEVEIYSSVTGEWTYRKSEWGSVDFFEAPSQVVFLNGTLHLIIPWSSVILTVDKDGKAWRKIPLPPNMKAIGDCCFSCSLGCLHAALIHKHAQLIVWVLRDESEGWTLKHTASLAGAFAEREQLYCVLALCPGRDLIYLKTWTTVQINLVSYDMGTGKGRTICSLNEYYGLKPYTPCFVEWLADGHSENMITSP